MAAIFDVEIKVQWRFRQQTAACMDLHFHSLSVFMAKIQKKPAIYIGQFHPENVFSQHKLNKDP